MRRGKTFSFDAYRRSGALLDLRYSLDRDLSFVERLRFPRILVSAPSSVSALDAALFTLHLIGGVSYYKTFCPRRIVVRSGTLTRDQARFWNRVYERGLGEFFYQNQIDFRRLIRFPSARSSPRAHPAARVQRAPRHQPRVLVPFGGGKDSIVCAELCRRAGFAVTLFRIGSHPIISASAARLNLPLITIERTLSPKLFVLNRQGAYNGHVPFTAYVSAAAVLVAVVEGFDAVILSNERSASQGNVRYLGRTINHQWSKSLEFERAFRQYIHQFVDPSLEVFSLLRPLSELRIAQLFADVPSLHILFTSCNMNWKITGPRPRTRWCGRCVNCAHAFALHAAFWPPARLTRVFGANLFDDADLLPTYRQLLGIAGAKPFACVGTPDELRAAFWLARRRGGWGTARAMRMFTAEVLPKIKNPRALVQKALKPSSPQSIPVRYRPALTRLRLEASAFAGASADRPGVSPGRKGEAGAPRRPPRTRGEGGQASAGVAGHLGATGASPGGSTGERQQNLRFYVKT